MKCVNEKSYSMSVAFQIGNLKHMTKHYQYN